MSDMLCYLTCTLYFPWWNVSSMKPDALVCLIRFLSSQEGAQQKLPNKHLFH